MTLLRQLMLTIVVLFLVMFVGTLLVNVYSTSQFLEEQLASHAQDTATSLGLSLSPHMQNDDLPTMTAMVDAIFDRGYYRTIRVQSIDGEPLLERTLDVRIDGVPAWFVERIWLATPEANAIIMSGWRQAATVQVASHPGYAYQELWHTATRMLSWFAGTAALFAIIGGLALRILLSPLRTVERQAEAISARNYDIQGKVPRTRELRNVVLAMNRMTGKIKETFTEQSRTVERLREQVYADSVSGLGNRRYFDAQLKSRLQSSEVATHGALFLIQLGGLKELNDTQGFAAGDRLLRAAAEVITQVSGGVDDSIRARLTGADFAIAIPNVDTEVAEQLAAELCDRLAQLHAQGLTISNEVGHVGVVLYAPGKSASELLSQADLALRTAQAQGPNAWHHYRDAEATTPVVHGRQEWKACIEAVVQARNVVLFAQPVVTATDSGALLHQEIFARIPGPDGALLSAGAFMPMVEHLHNARDIDRIVLEKLFAGLVAGHSKVPYAVNLSPESLRDEAFVEWLLAALPRAAGPEVRLIFEFAEFAAVHELAAVQRFVEQIRPLGHGVGLDHFGRSFTACGYLQSLRPDYVKIDGAYTANLAQSRDEQFFVNALGSVARSLDTDVIAQAVEDPAQIALLRELGVNGVQGYAIGRPVELQTR